MPRSLRDWTKIAVFCAVFAVLSGALQMAVGAEVPQMLAGVAVATAIMAFVAIKTNWIIR